MSGSYLFHGTVIFCVWGWLEFQASLSDLGFEQAFRIDGSDLRSICCFGCHPCWWRSISDCVHFRLHL